LQGQAVDGKALRGARAHGTAPHLVSVVQHASGLMVAETAATEKSNEITAVPRLLAGRDLSGTVTTMDAMHAQKTTAQQILDQGDHCVMVVKENQPDLYHAIQLLFDQPPAWSTNAPPSIRSNVFPIKGTGGVRCAPWNAVLP